MGTWKSKNRHKYLLQYHIIFVCKYRKKLLVSRQISDDIKQFSYEICQRHSVIIRYMEKISPIFRKTILERTYLSRAGHSLAVRDVPERQTPEYRGKPDVVCHLRSGTDLLYHLLLPLSACLYPELPLCLPYAFCRDPGPGGSPRTRQQSSPDGYHHSVLRLIDRPVFTAGDITS